MTQALENVKYDAEIKLFEKRSLFTPIHCCKDHKKYLTISYPNELIFLLVNRLALLLKQKVLKSHPVQKQFQFILFFFSRTFVSCYTPEIFKSLGN